MSGENEAASDSAEEEINRIRQKLRKRKAQWDRRKAGMNEKIKVVLDEGATLPTRSHEEDAGLDLYSRESVEIRPRGFHIFDTGVHIEIPRGYAGMIKTRSGMYVNHGLHCEGVVDSGFTGTVKVRVCNLSEGAYYVEAGDRIGQIVIVKILAPDPVEADTLGDAPRGDSGYGSTGR